MTSKQLLDVKGRAFNRGLSDWIKDRATLNVFTSLVGKSVARTAGEFSGEVKKEVPRMFKTFSAKKLDSIAGHRGKEKNKITYHVGAGEGIPGHLNYLSGLYEGRATSKSGKVFSYKQPRDLIGAANKKYNAAQKVAVYLDYYVKELENEI